MTGAPSTPDVLRSVVEHRLVKDGYALTEIHTMTGDTVREHYSISIEGEAIARDELAACLAERINAALRALVPRREAP